MLYTTHIKILKTAFKNNFKTYKLCNLSPLSFTYNFLILYVSINRILGGLSLSKKYSSPFRKFLKFLCKFFNLLVF